MYIHRKQNWMETSKNGNSGYHWVTFILFSPVFSINLKKIYLFFVGCGLSLVVRSRGYSLAALPRLLIVVAGLCCRARALGHGLSCPQHVESSQTKDQTCVPYTGR